MKLLRIVLVVVVLTAYYMTAFSQVISESSYINDKGDSVSMGKYLKADEVTYTFTDSKLMVDVSSEEFISVYVIKDKFELSGVKIYKIKGSDSEFYIEYTPEGEIIWSLGNHKYIKESGEGLIVNIK
tara:strand:+ start:1283 stop:1663 length:381 start_codon:yes stop_codon:yes gene_type:complete